MDKAGFFGADPLQRMTHLLPADMAASTTATTSGSMRLASAVNATFDIQVSFSGDAAYQSYFTQAAARWMQIVTGDLPDVTSSPFGFVDDLLISASVVPIDGPGGTLGQAGPDSFRGGSSLPYHGVMEFDSADLADLVADGTLDEVILHEMGHVLGLGTLWDFLGLENGFAYVGQNALREYRTLFGDATATAVPVERFGGPGTAGGHWSEDIFGNEMMTGYVDGAMPISRMTVGSLQDMGYTVAYTAANPYALSGAVAGDDYGSNAATAGPIAINTPAAGNLSALGDRDWFRVSLVAGRTYTVSLGGAGGGVGSLADPYLRLLDGNGQIVALDDDAGPAADSALTYTPTASGTYYVMAGAYDDGSTGTYRVSVTGPAMAPTARDDFNRNGTGDLLLQGGGTVVNWLISNGAYSGANVLATALPAGWSVVATGDFNRDGGGDVLLQGGGTLVAWFLDASGAYAGGIAVNGSPLPAGWTVAGTGDMNADGITDVVLQGGGTVVNWMLDAFGRYQGGNVLATNLPAGWQVVGVGDLNGDAVADIVLQDGSTVVDWILDGAGAVQGSNVLSTSLPAGFTVRALGDLDANGADDLVVQGGSIVVDWLISNGQYVGGNTITSALPAGWTVTGAGDFNADGTSDISLQGGSNVVAWFMQSGQYAGGSVISSALPAGWSVVGKT